MPAHNAVSATRKLELVSIPALMQDLEEPLETVQWFWIAPGGTGLCIARNGMFPVSEFTVEQLRHVMLCAYQHGAAQNRPEGTAGLEFRVVTVLGRCAVISAADEVKAVFKACMPRGGHLRDSRALLDAMRLQSDRQVGLDTAML